MTIASTTRTAGPFSGTGLIVSYPFSFKVFQASDLLVQQTDTSGNVTTWSLGGNYSVLLNADQSASPGGTITPLAALPTGYSLNVTSAVSITQPASLTNAGGFFPKTIEDALDRLTILAQQYQTTLNGALRVPEIGGVGLLPAAAQRAGLLLGWDGNGQPAAVTGPLAASPVVATMKRETQTATANQTVFTLATMSYSSATPGSILVIAGGAVIAATAVTQTSPTVVTLATGVTVGTKVEFIAGNFTSLSSGSFSATHTTSAINDVGSFQFRRNQELAGGTPGFVNSCIRADSFVDNAGATGFEWAITGVVHNNATGGQNVGVVGYGFKLGGGVGPTFGGNFGVFESTAINNPTYGSVGCEIDNASNGTDSGTNRVILDCVAFRQNPTGADTACSYGVRVSNAKDGSHTSIGTAFMVGNSDASLMPVGVAFDCAAATMSIGALRMPQGAPILFDGAGSNQLSYDGTGLYYKHAGVSALRLNGDGSIQFGGTTLPVVLKGTTASTATTGAAGALPAQALGYLIATISGTTVKIPYYSN